MDADGDGDTGGELATIRTDRRPGPVFTTAGRGNFAGGDDELITSKLY